MASETKTFNAFISKSRGIIPAFSMICPVMFADGSPHWTIKSNGRSFPARRPEPPIPSIELATEPRNQRKQKDDNGEKAPDSGNFARIVRQKSCEAGSC